MDKQSEPDVETVEADERDSTHAHVADRPPSNREEQLAERAAQASSSGEMAEVAEHYEEMMRIGADAKGEGRIE